jgi:nitrilase
MKISLIQMNSRNDKAANLDSLRHLIEAAVLADAPDWIGLPEHCEWLGGSAGAPGVAEPFSGGPTYTLLSALAREHRVWIHGGSFYEQAGEPGKAFNTSVVFNRDGGEVVRYRKMHMFDVTTSDGAVYAESRTVMPGRDIVTYDCEGLNFGCAICYDLRFPELFQALGRAGVDVIVLPSAFTYLTGLAHWEPLIRARAIETETWFLAPAQWGDYETPNGIRRSFGHSMVVDPWGAITACRPDGVGHISSEVSRTRIDEVRAQIPVWTNKVLL